MLLGIDHLVIAVADPDAAAADLEERVGLRASGGGRHEALGTFNRLIWLGDAYLELIGVFDVGLAEKSWLGPAVLDALAAGGGLASWAVATDDIEFEVARLRTAGVDARTIAGERVRPDGRVVRWRLALGGPLGPERPPFLIEHDATAAEWTPEDRDARAAEEHPVGARIRLAGLALPALDAIAMPQFEALGVAFDRTPTGVEGVVGVQRLVVDRRLGAPTVRLRADRRIEGRAFESRTIEAAGVEFALEAQR